MTNIIQNTTSRSDISNSSITLANTAANTSLPANIANNPNISSSGIVQASTISANNHHQTGSSGASGSGAAGSSGTSGGNQETCLICGDVASGKHYGLRSCEACKAFFKRTVQGKIEYSCPATRECEINKRRRKACQACRFQKCLDMGMLKEGVRLDRVRGGRQKYRRGTSPSLNAGGAGAGCLSASSLNNNSSSASAMSNINSNNNNGGSTSLNINGNQANSSSLLSSTASLAASASGLSHSAFPLANVTTIAATHQQTAIGTGETNKIMTALINCEPEELSVSPAQYVSNIPSNLNVQLKTLYILGDLFDRELVSLIGWAKQIPGFSETITLNDQMRLLQSTWAEVIALSIGYRSHLKRIECYKQQQQQLGGVGIGGSSSTSGLGIHHFMNATTPSPTSSSPASTTSSSYNNHSANSSSLYNLENVEIRLVFAKDLIIDFKHAILCGAEEIFYNCVQLIKRLDHLRITPKEYILLKAISLTNADVRLENPKATFRLRDLVMDALYEVTLTEYLNAGGLICQNDIASLANIKQEISSGNNNNNNNNNNNGGGSGSGSASMQQLKVEAQERPPSSMNQYASSSSSPTPPSRSSSSVPSSSSTSSISPHNSNNNNNNNNNNNSNNNNNGSSSGGGGSSSSSNIINTNAANSDLGRRTIINNRMNQVLLCLPVLRQIDTSIRKFWNDIRKGPNNVPMNKLFEEMLEPCQRMYRSSVEM